MTPDGNRIVSGSGDGLINVWDIKSGRVLKTLKGHTEGILVIALTPDNSRIISGSQDNTLKVWDLENENVIASYKADGFISSCTISQDGELIIAGDSTGSIHFLRLENA